MPERVNNLGLMKASQNYLIFSGILSVAGLLLIVLSKKKTNPSEEHSYKILYERGKIAEYKGKLDEAIDLYLETMYHLENDYKNVKLSWSFDQSRIKLIGTLKAKVDILKGKTDDKNKPTLGENENNPIENENPDPVVEYSLIELSKAEEKQVDAFMQYGLKADERLIINKISRKIERVDDKKWGNVKQKEWIIIVDKK